MGHKSTDYTVNISSSYATKERIESKLRETTGSTIAMASSNASISGCASPGAESSSNGTAPAVANNNNNNNNNISNNISNDNTIQLSKYSIAVPSAIASLASTSASSATAILDPNYEPGAFDVVCGRGKGAYNRPGNRHFHKIVAECMPRYTQARSKIDKSVILSEIVDRVQSLIDPKTERRAQFVQFSKKGGWIVIGDDAAREKVGHAMREAMQTREKARLTTCSNSSSSSSCSSNGSSSGSISSSLGQKASPNEATTSDNKQMN